MIGKRQTAPVRRGQLLEAAKELFSQSGYEATSTRAIATQAGVSEALLFRFFPTKLALFHAVIQEFGFRRLMPVDPDPLWQLPLEAMLRTVLVDFLDVFWKNRAAFRLLIASSPRDSEVSDDLQAYIVRPKEGLTKLLVAQETRGALKAGEARAAASVVSAAVSGFLFRSIQFEPEDWTETRAVFIADLLRLILPGITP